MADKIKLLLVEDEQTLADIIADTLSGNGFDVRVAYDGEQGIAACEEFTPDVIVSDIMMPKVDGFSLADRLRRSHSRIPILFLSARSSADDVVEGFERGASDYLRKPFAMSELIVRLRSLVGRADRKENSQRRKYEVGSYVFDYDKRLLLHGDCRETLSARETEVLRMLVEPIGQTVAINAILLKAWDDDSFFAARSLHVFITKLRHRFADDQRIRIVNARGIGYKLMIDE
ncbi:MAG: response regulator transcription factor [Alistipes sp.]|nr:response regulator transcription factor [Alistipes sp.]